jgi:hypothetical protein
MDDWLGWEVRCGDLREQNLNRSRARMWLETKMRGGAQVSDLEAYWKGKRASIFCGTVTGTKYLVLRGPDGRVWPHEDQ